MLIRPRTEVQPAAIMSLGCPFNWKEFQSWLMGFKFGNDSFYGLFTLRLFRNNNNWMLIYAT